MRYNYFNSAVSAVVDRVSCNYRMRVAFGIVLIGIGLLGSTGAALATYQPASAASSVVCQPNTHFSLPAALSLTSAVTGLTYKNDGTSYYHVGGKSVSAIRSALNQCAPTLNGTGDYLAYTSYAVSWSYNVETGHNDTCTLSNVKIGLHVNQLLPSLLGKTSESKSIQNKWNAFRIALHTHEDGHTSLDVAQAKTLLSTLQNLSAPCETIAPSAQAITTASVNQFVTLNTKHDTDTDYGRDQGAVF